MENPRSYGEVGPGQPFPTMPSPDRTRMDRQTALRISGCSDVFFNIPFSYLIIVPSRITFFFSGPHSNFVSKKKKPLQQIDQLVIDVSVIVEDFIKILFREAKFWTRGFTDSFMHSSTSFSFSSLPRFPHPSSIHLYIHSLLPKKRSRNRPPTPETHLLLLTNQRTLYKPKTPRAQNPPPLLLINIYNPLREVNPTTSPTRGRAKQWTKWNDQTELTKGECHFKY